jgi:DNA-binding NtrC family response regulator
MSSRGPAQEIRHAVLSTASGLPLAEARLSDRQRLACLLQGLALAAIFERGRWRLPQGWRGAQVGPQGLLQISAAGPGAATEAPQISLLRLQALLFGGEDRPSGRGQSRRIARLLWDRWRQSLTPLRPHREAAWLLAEAPFLWEEGFAATRACLVGELVWPQGTELWGLGPRSFRRALHGREGSLAETQVWVQTAQARRLWQEDGAGDAVALALAGQSRQALEAWRRQPAAKRTERKLLARSLFDQGQFLKAFEVLEKDSSLPGRILRLQCLQALGRWPAAQASLRRLAEASLSAEQLLEVVEAALRVLPNAGDAQGTRQWTERGLAAAQGASARCRLKANLLAAVGAVDLGLDPQGFLAAAAGAKQDRILAWRWHQAQALAAAHRGAFGEALEHGATILRRHRRSLRPFEAAGVWNDLGLGRARMGSLAGAEMAFLHAQRLMERCEGPRRHTLALFNLAEIRLRRGRLGGVREALETSTAENRLAQNLRGSIHDDALWARYELTLGRPQPALLHLRRARRRLEETEQNWILPELRLLSARAWGLAGEPERAAQELRDLASETVLTLEPEERPAVFAHAGLRQEALVAAESTPFRDLWFSFLAGATPTVPEWQILESLEPYRAARLVLDLELLRPGTTPPFWRRRGVDTFYYLGATASAQLLAARDQGPWEALSHFLASPGMSHDLETLFAGAGYAEVSLIWRDHLGEEQHLVGPRTPSSPARASSSAGSASPERPETVLEEEVAGGTLVARCPAPDSVLRALVRLAAVTLEPPRPAARSAGKGEVGGILGESEALRKVLKRLQRLAPTDVPVLIQGESGTGKELAAAYLHRASQRQGGTFVALNCAALSETLVLSDLFGHARGAFTGADRERAGVFETARGGTVFLDEIGDLPLSAQGNLLRVLQEGEVRRLGESLPRKVDVRIIAATHRNLSEMVQGEAFREDLFYRLKVGSVTLPALRERGKDVLLLADHFAATGSRPIKISAAARAQILAHGWPGNIRELRNGIRLAAALAEGDEILPEHLELSQETARSADYHQSLEAFRRRLIADALRGAGGNQAEAARRLGLSRQALSYQIKQLRLQIEP